MPEINSLEQFEDPPQNSDGAALFAAPSRPLEIITALSCTLMGIAVFIASRGITLRTESSGIDPTWWPTLIAAGMTIMGLWMLAEAIFRLPSRDVEPARRSGWIQMIATVAAIAIVLALWHFRVNFLALGPLYLATMNWIYDLRGWKSVIMFPAIVTLIIYLLFQLLLKVPL